MEDRDKLFYDERIINQSVTALSRSRRVLDRLRNTPAPPSPQARPHQPGDLKIFDKPDEN